MSCRVLLPLVALWATLLLGACSTSQARAVRGTSAPDAPEASAPQAESLDQLLSQDDFDLPRSLLLFSQEYAAEFGVEPPESVDAWQERFARYTSELKRDLKRDALPRARLLTLIEFVHGKLGLRFDSADMQGHDPQNLFFDNVITRRQGYCVTLSLAYIVFGQAAGLEVYGVRIPGHFAVQFKDFSGEEKFTALVESTAQGSLLDELEVWARHRFSAQSVEAGCYLTPLTDRQILAVMYNNLAGLTHLRGDSAKALERYNRSLELGPNNPEALYNRALIQRNLNLAQPALRDLNAAIRLDPNFTLALLARAGLLFEAGETEAGRQDLALALRQRPEWPQPHLLEGTLAASEGRLEDARAAFERALQRDPMSKDAHKALAQVERKLGNHQKAAEHEAAAR